MNNESKIELRKERSDGNFRHLTAEVLENGDLVIEGYDLGSAVEEVFGSREYEWTWTVKAADIRKFKKKLEGEGSILELLKRHFSDANSAGLHAFMKLNRIRFKTWSRTGD